MKKQLLALAVAAGTLGLSQMASADFVSDSKLTLGLRNFYFNNDPRESTGNREESWAQGAVLNYQSGFTEGAVGFGLDAIGMVGLRLDGGRGHHPNGSSFIPSEGDGSAVDDWSQAGATAKMRFSKTELRYGTLMPKLPVLTYSDGRLLPQTFEGTQITVKEIDNLTLTGGLIERAVGRASTNDTGLSISGATQDSNKFWFAGGDWKVTKDLTAQYYYAKLEDFYTQHFVGLTHVLPLGDQQSLKSDLRYFKSDADGRNDDGAAGYGTKVDNRTWSAAFTYSLGSHALLLGYQRVSDDGAFVQPNQGTLTNEGAGGASVYLLTDRMLTAFTRAGERTTFGQYTYDFTQMGVPGLKANVAYLKGTNIQTAGSDQKEWERDIGVEYTLQSGPAKGLGISVRHGVLRSEAATDGDQTRIILNYALNIL